MTTDGEVQLEEEKSIIFNEFKHYDDVVAYIRSIPSVVKDSGEEELLEEELKRVFNFYQEQPHLLDPYLERLISECLTVVHASVEKPKAFHFAFRVLYLMVKTRGYKSVIRLMPHTVDDVEPTLNLLVAQDINDLQTWQTRYVLLLWLSILTLIPFGLESLDSMEGVPIVERVLTQSKRYLGCDERIQEAASFLLARLVTRPDVVTVHLNDTITWGLQQLRAVDHTTSSGQNEICGILRTLSNICKIGRRTELLPLASSVLHAVLALPTDTTKGILIYRLVIKLIQRVGLLFCPPRVTTWQYQRGSRSLADNLVSRMDVSNKTGPMDDTSMKKPIGAENGSMCQLPSAIEVDEDCDLNYADDVAEVIDRLLNALRSQYTVVRWSAAKGLGRMCNRLSSPMVSDVLTAVLSLCTRLEPFSAWHGACLTLAELGRRSLLLPSKLPEVIPVILRALFYDERSGDHSYGTNVRDAACYVCWAFARAYNARDFAPYVRQVANALVLVSLFDREVNVRRAAAAAFQENVGRQGQFPHGIDIITTCDYFALRNRTNCFLELSVFVAQFEEYTTSMIDHLSSQLLGHWDISIRFLAARALNVLCPFASEYMLHTVLPQLVRNSTEAGLYAKQGNIFGTAQLIFALKDTPIQSEVLSGVKEIEPTLQSRNQLRGISGELLRKAVCHLIEHCSLAKLPFHSDPIVDLWRIFLDECIVHKEVEVQNAAKAAYPAFLTTYLYTGTGALRVDYRDELFAHLLAQLRDTTSESKLAGYLYVFAHAPADLCSGHVSILMDQLVTACRISPKTRCWGEARGNALASLVGLCEQLGPKHLEMTAAVLNPVWPNLLRSLADYTLDSRGDIGSRVRETGMECLQKFLSFLTTNRLVDYIQPDLVLETVVCIVQQALEKIDRTRGVAGQVFATLLHHQPPIPHFPHLDALKRLFPKEECDKLVWRSARQIFPNFIRLLEFPDFRFRIILGLTVSVGGLTEDTVICSTEALANYLLLHEQDIVFIHDFLTVVEQVFETYSHDERIIVPWFKFIDFLLNNPVICSAVEKDSPIMLRLIENIWLQTKSVRDVHRIKAAIDAFGGMLQFEGPIQKRAKYILLILLGHRYPVIRKSAATKLYECLLVYDLTEPNLLDQTVNLLTETIWESDISVVRPVRNHLCELFGSDVPVSAGSKSSQNNQSPLDLNNKDGDVR